MAYCEKNGIHWEESINRINIMRMPILLSGVLLLFCQLSMFAQTEPASSSDELERVETFLPGSTITLSKSRDQFFVNDKEVNESEFNWYRTAFSNKCCPCIYEYYDERYKLVAETVACKECRECRECQVGWYKEYYRNGKLKISGQYKENPTENWKDMIERGFCSVKDGEWLYYSKSGKLKFREVWKEGELIEEKGR